MTRNQAARIADGHSYILSYVRDDLRSYVALIFGSTYEEEWYVKAIAMKMYGPEESISVISPSTIAMLLWYRGSRAGLSVAAADPGTGSVIFMKKEAVGSESGVLCVPVDPLLATFRYVHPYCAARVLYGCQGTRRAMTSQPLPKASVRCRDDQSRH